MTTNPFFYDESHIADRCLWRALNARSRISIGKVVGINVEPVSVNVQPLVNYFDQIGGWTQYPVLSYVPLAQLQVSNASINLPLNIGDTGIILWFDREVYTNLVAGAVVPSAPDSGNMYDQNACAFLPFITSFSSANPIQNTGVDIGSNGIYLIPQITDLLNALNNFAIAAASAVPALAPACADLEAAIATLLLNFIRFQGTQP